MLKTLEDPSLQIWQNILSNPSREPRNKESQLKTKLLSLLPMTPLSERPWPRTSWALTSAPASKSTDTIEAWPCLAAQWSAVSPRRAEAELSGTSPKALLAPERIFGDSGSCGWKQRVKEERWHYDQTIWWISSARFCKMAYFKLSLQLWSMVKWLECAWRR